MHNFDLNNRTAVVTGGAQGFGYAIVKRFLASGANVVIWDIDKKFINISLKEANSEKLSYQIVDITNHDEIKKNFAELSSKHKIDIFVNNAGVAGLNDKVWNYPNEEWLKVINTNLNSTFYCCKTVIPHMIENNYDDLITIEPNFKRSGSVRIFKYKFLLNIMLQDSNQSHNLALALNFLKF